jgi:hypothetical protein
MAAPIPHHIESGLPFSCPTGGNDLPLIKERIIILWSNWSKFNTKMEGRGNNKWGEGENVFWELNLGMVALTNY